MSTGFRRLFIDSGAFIALADRSDSHHGQAGLTFRNLVADRVDIVTTSCVIGEAYTWMRYRLGAEPAIRWLDTVERAEASGMLEVMYPGQDIDKRARENLRRFSDQDLSFVDALSLTVLPAIAVDGVFTFDHHFVLSGLPLVPGAV